MKTKLLSYYEEDTNEVVKAIAKSVDADITFMDFDFETQVYIVEKMFSAYKDGWNNAKLLLLPDLKR